MDKLHVAANRDSVAKILGCQPNNVITSIELFWAGEEVYIDWPDQRLTKKGWWLRFRSKLCGDALGTSVQLQLRADYDKIPRLTYNSRTDPKDILNELREVDSELPDDFILITRTGPSLSAMLKHGLKPIARVWTNRFVPIGRNDSDVYVDVCWMCQSSGIDTAIPPVQLLSFNNASTWTGRLKPFNLQPTQSKPLTFLGCYDRKLFETALHDYPGAISLPICGGELFSSDDLTRIASMPLTWDQVLRQSRTSDDDDDCS